MKAGRLLLLFFLPSRITQEHAPKLCLCYCRTVDGDTVLNKGWNRHGSKMFVGILLNTAPWEFTRHTHPTHTSLLLSSFLPLDEPLLPFLPSFLCSLFPSSSLLPSFLLPNLHNWFHITCRIYTSFPSLAWHSRLSGFWLHSVLSLYFP